jgi:two-component system sensor histidine kinase VicK
VVYLDLQLLDQMVDNLLDNAGKYSTEPSTASIACGLTREDRYFFVSVSNKGLPVTAVKARTLMQRGTRSDQAVWGGQQGSGLGLYLVSKILEAHKGLLEIIPTDKRGITDFRLLFPVGPRRL